MSQQISLQGKSGHARFFAAHLPAAPIAARGAAPLPDSAESVDGLVDIDALHRELARMKASRANKTDDRSATR